MRAYVVTQYNAHIPDSYEVSKRGFDGILDSLQIQYPHCEVWQRKRWSLKAEWSVRVFLYNLGIAREHTKDVDLNVPQPWYVRVAYNVIGAIVWPFIK